ncbi:MAG: HAD-IA family hydrolase [Planctomycetota bacterium]
MFALIFDVDGVIVDTETLNARASADAFTELYGVFVRPEDFVPFIGTGDENYMLGPARKYGVSIDVERATRQREENLLALVAHEGLSPFPGVLELIREARDAGDCKLAVATSGRSSKALPLLSAAKIDLEAFDLVVTGDEVRKKKPDPEIYLEAISRLDLSASACVVIEDAPAGVEAAKAAGARCVAVTNSVVADKLPEADLVVSSLSELSLDDLRALAKPCEPGSTQGDAFITVARFLNLLQADLARARLELEGIECRLHDVYFPYAASQGALRLDVRASDTDRAREILSSRDAETHD